MTKGKVIVVLLIVAGTLWLLVGSPPVLNRDQEDNAPEGPGNDGHGSIVTTFTVGGKKMSHPASIDEGNTDHRFTRFSDGVVYLHHPIALSVGLHQEDQSVRHDLEILDEIMASYRLVYKENPVGTDNEEFAAALSGENPKKIVFIDPGLLSDGVLLDRFGSPYLFHPMKAEVMDIRSHGPDGLLWSDDDVSLDLQEVGRELGLSPED